MATIEARKGANGTSYRVSIRLKGHPPVYGRFSRLTAAKAWASRIETEMRDGAYATGSGRTVAEAIDAFLAEQLADKKDQRTLAARLRWWRNRLGSVRLRDLTAWHISVRLAELAGEPQPAKKSGGLRKPRAAATWNRYRSAISAPLSWAERQSPPWITRNPAKLTKRHKEPRGRTRFLSNQEREAFLTAAKCSASTDLYPAVVLSLATGARHGEIMGLRWSEVDLENGVLEFCDTKNGDTRRVPLPTAAIKMLRERRRVVRLDTDLVFPSAKNPAKPVDLRASFHAAVRRAGIGDFRWHDQRHSAASALADMGASLLDIGTILGHRSQQTTKRYAHLTDSRLRHLVEQASQKHRVA
jgi:integrase